MAARADNKISLGTVQDFFASGTVTRGFRVKFGAGDDLCVNCGAGESGIGIALADATTGQSVQILLEGHAVVPMKVGTGGATRGGFAVPVADGVTTQAIADGTTPRHLVGKFMQTGVAGDLVGVLIGCTTPTPTA
jgi:hypothetical protein